MTRWFALNNLGDMIPLGEHHDFDGASDKADSFTTFNCIWIVDEESFRNWRTQIDLLLKGAHYAGGGYVERDPS